MAHYYAWLVIDQDQLKIVKTENAMNPIVNRQIPLLTCDVWEHIYYLNYQNRRQHFLQTFFPYLENWEFVTGAATSASISHRVTTDVEELARLTLLETVQLNRLHDFLPEIIALSL